MFILLMVEELNLMYAGAQVTTVRVGGAGDYFVSINGMEQSL